MKRSLMALGAASLAATLAAFAQQPRTAVEEIERYRAALGDGNPAELWEARGEALWLYRERGGDWFVHGVFA